MKISVQNLMVILILLFSCEIDRGSDMEIDPPEIDKVKEVLNGPLFTPKGKLRSQFDFQGFHSLLGRTDHYYDDSERRLLSVAFSSDNDSSSVFLYEYDDTGNETSKNQYTKYEGKYILYRKYLKKYDGQGRILSETYDSRPIRSYFYDEQGFNYKILLGSEPNGECHFFYPDEQNRIKRMVWSSCNEGDTPIMAYFFRYNSMNQLEAKETYGTGNTEREDAFQYFYNDSGQLIDIKEYYPQWGFVPRFRTTYEYYSE